MAGSAIRQDQPPASLTASAGTKLCRLRGCGQRFVPKAPGHFYHSDACRLRAWARRLPPIYREAPALLTVDLPGGPRHFAARSKPCACGCGRQVPPRCKWAGEACRSRWRRRHSVLRMAEALVALPPIVTPADAVAQDVLRSATLTVALRMVLEHKSVVWHGDLDQIPALGAASIHGHSYAPVCAHCGRDPRG